MAQVELSHHALADLGRLRRWLADKNPGAAKRAAAEIEQGIAQLGQFPLMGHESGGVGGRELAIDFGRNGYLVRYRVFGDRVIVTRIFHGRERR